VAKPRILGFCAGAARGGLDNPGMYLRAGAISLTLLLASRVLGLLRESVQAAAFGTTAMGDLAVVMLTLPDLASAILASGALAYALLPWWARQSRPGLARSQRRAAQVLAGVGVLVALGLWIWPGTAGAWLAPGLGPEAQPQLVTAIHWASLAVPLSLLGSLWYTRLQHERDVVGMYGMNVVHTGVVIGAMLLVWRSAHDGQAISWLGMGLVLALALRLAFLRWRLARVALAPMPAGIDTASALPGWRIWFWALLATGVPAALPLLARTMVSRSGEGALAAFNYAWKLVELPNLLAIQLVATLALPAFTRAYAEGREFSVQLRSAFVLAWALACAAAVGLWLGARPLAGLLFHWGRMDALRVAEVADWAALGAWTLLPQALIAVAVLVLVTVGRLRQAASAYAVTLLLLFAAGRLGVHDGGAVMLTLGVLLSLLAAFLLWQARHHARQALPWREMAAPAVLAAVLVPVRWLIPDQALPQLAVAGVLAAGVLAAAYAASPVLRSVLKR
jgi:putative peptidoglycan lipid II flippase